MTDILSNPDTWETVGLLIVIAIILWQRVPSMIGAHLDARAATITRELEQAQALRQEAQTILVDYQQRARAAQSEAEAIVTETRAEAERFASEQRAALKVQIERRAEAAQHQIAMAEQQAVLEIRKLAADAAVAAAEKIIAARLDETRAAALVSDSLRDLSAKLN
jgi:F-type H+-transporting ATPase subunit b